MRKKVIASLLTATAVVGMLAGCGGSSDSGSDTAASGEEGKVINIYSWNDEFRTRLEAIYPEVESTSDDGTVTTLKDGTEIHWIINPNQDGVYQQKLDEALLNQADAAADDKIDIFLSETDYVYKYTDADADVAMPLEDLGEPLEGELPLLHIADEAIHRFTILPHRLAEHRGPSSRRRGPPAGG